MGEADQFLIIYEALKYKYMLCPTFQIFYQKSPFKSVDTIPVIKFLALTYLIPLFSCCILFTHFISIIKVYVDYLFLHIKSYKAWKKHLHNVFKKTTSGCRTRRSGMERVRGKKCSSTLYFRFHLLVISNIFFLLCLL